jgi:hypothetical protein
MEQQEKLNRLYKELTKSNNDEIIKDLIGIFDEENLIHFDSGVDSKVIYKGHSERLLHLKKKADFSILGMENLLKELSCCNQELIFQTKIITKECTYIIFSNHNFDKVFGVIKTPYSNIEKCLDIEKQERVNSNRSIYSIMKKGLIL